VNTAKKFRVDILTGTFGTVFAYAISILLLPLITRYYQPEHIGVWQVLLATVGIIMPLATFQFESAIILEKNKRLISYLISIVLINTTIICTLLLLTIIFFGDELSNFLNIHIVINIGWLLIIAIIIQACFLVFTALVVKEKHFKIQAIAKILGALTVPSFALIALFFFEASSLIYVEAAILGIFVQVIVLYQQVDTRYFLSFKLWRKEKKLLAIRRHKVYPVYMTPYALSHGAVWQITLMSLGVLFSTNTVGAYAVARQLVYMPVSLLTAGLKQVIFSHASSEEKYSKDINNRISTLLINIVNISIPFSVFSFFYLSDIINVFLGDGWEKVGIFAPWILIPAIALMLTSWLDRIFDVYGRQRYAVSLQILSDISFLLVLLICYLLNTNSVVTVISLSLFVAIYNLLWLFIVLSILGFNPKFWVFLMLRLIMIGVISFSLIKILGVFLSFNFALLIEVLILFSITYYVYLKIRNFA
jgi:O-antigen/teichoic acid export membrane protein